MAQVEVGTSLDEQRRRCRARIDSEGWAFVGEYSDEGVSGALASRPSLDSLMAECRAGSIDAVVVLKLDRFGRSNRDLENLLGELDDLGVRFVSVSESIDSGSASGRFLRTILGGTAEFERSTIRERTHSGLLAAVREGYWGGGVAPFGFEVVADGKHKRLAIKEAEAEVLRAAVSMIVDERLTTKETADRLNAQGSRPRVADRWLHQNLRRTLLDSPMSGEWTYSRQRGSRTPSTPPVTVEIPAIVSPQRHQELLQALGGTSTIRRANNAFLLSGGLLLSRCGARYQGMTRPNGRRQYRCAASMPYVENRCSCHRLDADDVEGAVWTEVVNLLGTPSRMLALAESVALEAAQRHDLGEEQVATIATTVSRLERALAAAYADKYTGRGDAVTMDRAISAMEDDLAAARGRMRVLESWSGTAARASTRAEQLIRLAESFGRSLADMPADRRRQVLDLLEVHVQVEDWVACEPCGGRGKLRGGTGGLPCPACRMTKWVPTLAIDGVVSAALLDLAQDDASLRGSDPLPYMPFVVSDSGVAL